MVEYWLSNCSKKPTWKSVAKALEKIGFHDLAKDILAVYKTGENTEIIATHLKISTLHK